MRLVMPAARVPVEPGPQTIRLVALKPERRYDRDNFRWLWVSERNGADFTSFSTARLGEGSKARPLIEALMGQRLAPGEELDTEELIGRTAEVVMALKPNGHARIEEVAPVTA